MLDILHLSIIQIFLVIITKLPGLRFRKTDPSGKLQEHTDWYLNETHRYQATISFCIGVSRTLSKILRKWLRLDKMISYFHKKPHLRCLTGFWIRLCFGIFIIFIIKPNFIWADNNPKLQNFFKTSKGASKRKLLSIVVKSSILDLA